MLPKKLHSKLIKRTTNNALRKLGTESSLVDFSSNDYLGYSKNEDIFFRASEILKELDIKQNGATGSRLLSGNHTLYTKAEKELREINQVPAALIFNSGYDANVGFFGCVPQRGDVVLYDEFIHASIRDGILLSPAKSYKFKHNSLNDLESRLSRRVHSRGEKEDRFVSEVYVVTESVFSMDGDSPDLNRVIDLCEKYKAHLVIDEAHALGVLGSKGLGLVRDIDNSHLVFARIITFGKALGAHGAAILCSKELKTYLINFARSLIYTTALPPHSLATLLASYKRLCADMEQHQNEYVILLEHISNFKKYLKSYNLESYFINSKSAIQSAIFPGNDRVKSLSDQLKEAGFDVKPILSPTVPAGQERLRFCLHSYNTDQEIRDVLKLLATFVEQ